MYLFLNLNKQTEFPTTPKEDVDSKSSLQNEETSVSTITSESKKVTTPDKNTQEKAPVMIPKLKIHSPPAMKIPISPRALKSPKRNPEEKKTIYGKKRFHRY